MVQPIFFKHLLAAPTSPGAGRFGAVEHALSRLDLTEEDLIFA